MLCEHMQGERNCVLGLEDSNKVEFAWFMLNHAVSSSLSLHSWAAVLHWSCCPLSRSVNQSMGCHLPEDGEKSRLRVWVPVWDVCTDYKHMREVSGIFSPPESHSESCLFLTDCERFWDEFIAQLRIPVSEGRLIQAMLRGAALDNWEEIKCGHGMNSNPSAFSSALLLLNGFHTHEPISKIQYLKNTFGGSKGLVLLPPGMSNVFTTKPGFSTSSKGSRAQNSQADHVKEIAESKYRCCVSRSAWRVQWWHCWLFISLALL